MPEVIFNAFLSCSFSDEDETVNSFFTKLIKSFDIIPETYDYQDMGKIPAKVKEKIIHCDCLIALATRRKKIESSDSWTCPDWIQHEIALANAYNKPIALFVEDGVRIDGFIAMEERRERFSRENLLKNVDKITTFLFNLRKYLEFTYETGLSQAPVLIRHYIHTKEEMLAKDYTTISRTEILLESLIDGLEATSHGVDKEEVTPELSVKPIDFEFKCKEMPDGVKVVSEIVTDTEYKFLWKVVFNPPLKKGEKVKYAYKRVSPYYRPHNYEELMRRIQQGTYEYKEPICEAVEWTITYPTYEIKAEFEFPENYEIQSPYTYVASGAARLKADQEIQRIKDGDMFMADKIFDKWLLRVEIPKPLIGHTYWVYYTPPKTIQ